MSVERNLRYRGHRADSYIALDGPELVEIRARQRTFNGAYIRTGLGNLGYAVAIVKLFDPRFYSVAIVYSVLGLLFFVVAFLRNTHSQRDFADSPSDSHFRQDSDQTSSQETEQTHPQNLALQTGVIRTKGQEGKRIFGRPFVTAGRIVILVSLLVAVIEGTLLVLILTSN